MFFPATQKQILYMMYRAYCLKNHEDPVFERMSRAVGEREPVRIELHFARNGKARSVQ